MDFIEQITQFSKRIESIKKNILTEEATKTSIILPFFQLLGYDVFNPYEFVPEFTADAGTKRGEKVDYAVMMNGEPLILVEAKPANTELSTKHMNQLLRYFTVTKAKFAILTNGLTYRFYSDLEEPNKMDTVPFLEFDLLNIKKDTVDELKRFQKENFDVKNILSSASELKYMTMLKKAISEQFQNPSDQLIKALVSKDIYSGAKTQSVLDKFREIIKRAFNEYVNDLITERISNAITSDIPTQLPKEDVEKNNYDLSDDELQILNHIKNMLNTDTEITYKKTSRYAYMHVGSSSTKWICRVYIRQSTHLFTLHEFDDANYACEYYFDSPEQLDQIKELILDVFQRCCKL